MNVMRERRLRGECGSDGEGLVPYRSVLYLDSHRLVRADWGAYILLQIGCDERRDDKGTGKEKESRIETAWIF